MGSRPLRLVTAAVLCVLLPSQALGRKVTIPPGTAVFGETDERVTSRVKKDGTEVGDVVTAHVWRDVIVDGNVVIKAGEPMFVRVGMVKKAKLAGIKGKLELEAVSVNAVDGTPILLNGGYDKSGRGRMGLSISLAAVVAWPLIFIHGKPAILDPGTVFDSDVRSQVVIEAAEGGAAPRTIRLGSGGGSFAAEVVYDEMSPEGKDKQLPLRLTQCGDGFASASVVSINEEPVAPVPVLVGMFTQEDDCTVVRGTLDLKELGKHFRKGINRFEIGSGERRSEIILDVEL
jgi:hypothetical protein